MNHPKWAIKSLLTAGSLHRYCCDPGVAPACGAQNTYRGGLVLRKGGLFMPENATSSIRNRIGCRSSMNLFLARS